MQRLEEDGEEVGLLDMVLAVIEDRLLDLHTSFPAEVVSVNGRKVNVRPIVPYTEEDDRGELVEQPLPEIRGVPVSFPGTRSAGMYFPLAAGDTGMVVVSEVSLDRYKEDGDKGPPQNRERNGLNGAWFIPGVFPGSDVSDAEGDPDATVVLGDDVRLGSSAASQFVALANLVKSELESIKTAFDMHQHVETGGTTNAPSMPLPPIGDVAAGKVKAE